MNWLDRLAIVFNGPADPRPSPRATPSVGATRPRGPEYEAANLPSRERFKTTAHFVQYCRELLPRVGLPAPAVDLFIAHIGRETGFGRGSADRGGKSLGVYDYNFGNIRAFATTIAPWYRHVDGLPYRAYMSGAEGLRDAVDFMVRNTRYNKAYEMMTRGEVLWYSELGIAGYYQTHDAQRRVINVTRENVGPSQASYERSLASVRRVG